MNDPVGVAGSIAATETEAQRASLVEHAKYATEKAASAIEAELAGKVNDAYYYWKLVFNQEFPSR